MSLPGCGFASLALQVCLSSVGSLECEGFLAEQARLDNMVTTIQMDIDDFVTLCMQLAFNCDSNKHFFIAQHVADFLSEQNITSAWKSQTFLLHSVNV